MVQLGTGVRWWRNFSLSSMAMRAWLQEYTELIAAFPPLHDGWFCAALPRARADDELARNEIYGASLGIALNVAQEFARVSAMPSADLIEEANTVIPRAFADFRGSNAAAW